MARQHWRWLGFVMVFTVANNLFAAADWRAGTVAGSRRVLREETGVFDAKPVVSISAARNEWESFQILVRSEELVRGVTIEPADLVGPSGARLAASEVRIYRQHQLEIKKASPRNKDFQPGWYPDALIPMRHPISGVSLTGARFSAAPFDLPPNQTHGFLIDLYIPVEARSGSYRGVYRLTGEGKAGVEVPVTLTVWDFALPVTPTLQTAFGSPASRLREYNHRQASQDHAQASADANWHAVEEQCSQLLSDHHINATPARLPWPVEQADGSFQIPKEQVKPLRAFIDRYHVNAIQLPHPDNVVKDPVREKVRLRAWLSAWDRAIDAVDRPAVFFYFYLLDEPNDQSAYLYVQSWGKAIRDAGTRVKVMVVEQPQSQDARWGNLHGSVDLWCPLFCLFEPEPAAHRQALGETVWTYTALCQGETMTPWWQTDFPLLHYRVPSWIAWRYHIRGLLYWGSMAFWEHVADPWVDAGTYRPEPKASGGGPAYHGEGSLVYPARAAGYEGIIPSLRLKALRDSIEDYEYLSILDRQRRSGEAMNEVLPVAGSWTRWSADPADFEDARTRLARAIVGRQEAR